MKKTILVVAAHADDMELSMGATALKYLDRGYDFHIVYSTNNMSGEYAWINEDGRIVSRHVPPTEEMRIRKAEAAKAAAFFGTEPVHLDYPQRHYFLDDAGTRVDVNFGSPVPEGIAADRPTILTAHEYPAEVSKLAEMIVRWDPEVIFTMGPVDTNPEHSGTCYLTMKARCKAAQAGCDNTLIYCTTPAPLHIAPLYDCFDTFIDTGGYMARKNEVVGCHASQKPRPEVLDYRDWEVGARCGCETAEAFVIGERARYKTGPLTAELLKNHLYCRENFHRIFLP